jgi:hypothetical protein
MMEAMNQVSSNLEFIWIFKDSFQDSKSLLCHLTDIDMLAWRVLKHFLSNLSWSFYKSWSIHCGEEHAKRWHQIDFILAIKRWNLLIIVNTLTQLSSGVINH